jgi:DinB superfamily
LKKKRVARATKKKRAVSKAGGAKAGGPNDASLRKHVVDLLKGGSAHVQFMDALEEFPTNKRGTFAPGLPHTGWQLLEHSRIAQWDILEFSRNPNHVSPGFPEGYWPKTPGPPGEGDWDKSVQQFQSDLDQMAELMKNPRTDLFSKIPHGDGQTILRQALVLADHNAYHLGQLVDLRRALGAWPHD